MVVFISQVLEYDHDKDTWVEIGKFRLQFAKPTLEGPFEVMDSRGSHAVLSVGGKELPCLCWG